MYSGRVLNIVLLTFIVCKTSCHLDCCRGGGAREKLGETRARQRVGRKTEKSGKVGIENAHTLKYIANPATMASMLRRYSGKYFHQLTQSQDACRLNAFILPLLTLVESTDTCNTFIRHKSTLADSSNKSHHASTKGSTNIILNDDTAPLSAITGSILTDNLDLLLTINPDLEGAIDSIRSSHLEDYEGNIRDQIESLVLQHGAARHHPLQQGAVSVTKTRLGKAKVDQLREVLEAIGADPRGNKDAIVQRLLKIYKEQQDGRSTVVTAAGDGSTQQQYQQQQYHPPPPPTPSPKNPNSTTIKNIPSSLSSHLSKPRIPIEKLKYIRPFTDPKEVANILLQAHAQDVVIIDVREQCTFTDYMVLATGISHGAVRLLAQAVMHELKVRCREGVPSMSPSVEGRVGKGQVVDWLVVDAGSVVAHVFTEQGREEYNLEGLWSSKSEGDDGGNNNITRLKSTTIGSGTGRQTLHTIKV